jgi:hypothetical protein
MAQHEITQPTAHLVRYEAACKALADARAVDEVQDIRNKAEAMRVYGMQAKNKTLEVDAAEIRIRAERKLGELIREQKGTVGLNRGTVVSGGKKPVVATDDRREKPTLADAGISKDLSSRAQKLAAVPAEEFEAEVGEWRQRVQAEHARVTTRLEKAGERAAKAAPEPDHDGPTLAELVDELQAENTRLTALIKASEADDLKAEAIKWRAAYDRALASQSEAMDAAARSEKREKFTMRQLMRCGKAVGEDDVRNIAAKVEAMARRKAAA